MAKDKTALPVNTGVLSVSGLNTKAITGVNYYKHGSVQVLEISYSGGSQFFKFLQGQCEVGGTNEWGTGTIS